MKKMKTQTKRRNKINILKKKTSSIKLKLIFFVDV